MLQSVNLADNHTIHNSSCTFQFLYQQNPVQQPSGEMADKSTVRTLSASPGVSITYRLGMTLLMTPWGQSPERQAVYAGKSALTRRLKSDQALHRSGNIRALKDVSTRKKKTMLLRCPNSFENQVLLFPLYKGQHWISLLHRSAMRTCTFNHESSW